MKTQTRSAPGLRSPKKLRKTLSVPKLNFPRRPRQAGHEHLLGPKGRNRDRPAPVRPQLGDQRAASRRHRPVGRAEAGELGAPSSSSREPSPEPYPETSLSFLANVYNQAARRFYARHGVTLIASAFEAHEETGEVALMTTKHCLRFSFKLCPKQARAMGIKGRVSARSADAGLRKREAQVYPTAGNA